MHESDCHMTEKQRLIVLLEHLVHRYGRGMADSVEEINFPNNSYWHEVVIIPKYLEEQQLCF